MFGLGLAGGSLLLWHFERAARPISFVDASGACYEGSMKAMQAAGG